MKVKLIPGEQLKNGRLRSQVMYATKQILKKKIESGEYQKDRDEDAANESKESI
ncbi:hypothetical protein [Geomicrobium sp. JCM 19039]|uniref:hypothetical protein n=1 Tax=Geomicrobium sp. JCM 19039 TaxID=1460636 RepID=UPI00045F3287|nr:hypothetical protein [Geomicrobium sp. JCM 19039]GAK11362.1 hypothetical protein JCM19039_1052 [Geomicrobium sp. JCM 19039]